MFFLYINIFFPLAESIYCDYSVRVVCALELMIHFCPAAGSVVMKAARLKEQEFPPCAGASLLSVVHTIQAKIILFL